MNHEDYIRPFNERGDVEGHRGSSLWLLHKKAFEGKLDQKEKDRLLEMLRNNSFFKDSVPLLGVRFNFRPVLKKYWVKDRYGDIREYLAPDKTSIRRNPYMRAVKITEMK
jgi:hypothetical protein